MKRFNGRSRILGILVVAAALATGAYAFTATNTVPDSSAGSGSGTISGYTVSAIAYHAERDDAQQHRLDDLHAEREPRRR